MCLSTIMTVSKESLPKSAYGWKIFAKKRSGRLTGQYHGNQMTFQYGETYIDPNPAVNKIVSDQPKGTGFRKYTTGFHAYASKLAAIGQSSAGEVVVRVRLSNIVAVGVQYGEKIYVGRTMKIYNKKEV